ncbi:DUF6708 domain-containing protein [Candidatus Schmidhempelia bombi]|uniref:DUF6708 domain-containing protein n=1 Tax=Candidatus Schmidhempelia bombi str. Bimp TaxID=1387197 RepID=A0AB94IF13_9GAMM|nr:DUF6708 domain-containing protein [Candidatus Schmidhempelia bombi]TEA28101.1 hypothetical protein O970_00625 [Candidatus Schmidhempelia bombi str. Bimp]
MPSKYRPQLFGWIGDLDKGPRSVPLHDDRLIYANDNYCAFRRKIASDQIFYLFLSFIALILGCAATITSFLLIINFKLNTETIILFIDIIATILSCAIVYIMVPELYQNLFTRRGSPIIFNRKTNKVYVNESYFFNFKFWRNPLTFLFPTKRRIKEYDWADLHGVVIHNYSRNALTTTILMVCKPGTYQTIDHILLDPARAGSGSTYVWGWINSFMEFYSSARLNDGQYISDEEAQFKRKVIEGQRWPEWMIEAFNATSPAELAEIKQRHNVKD